MYIHGNRAVIHICNALFVSEMAKRACKYSMYGKKRSNEFSWYIAF